MGAQGPKIPPYSPLGCVLKYWDKFGWDPLTKGKMGEYCNTWWSKYKLDNEEKWSEGGTLSYNITL